MNVLEETKDQNEVLNQKVDEIRVNLQISAP